ncbi:alpha/beta superfamily hydrolase (macronuclear) [Tetrahymena thermophila SB210]|uniref:Alpha/beta superfamily hydrolase n=1 Tax=Tetrahymena thermophila (strain SB210) TaxID=312017 RepID=Q23QW4_TETTS|nr:alpha/beta superfamily hydrolase [Tetrahymena thermophila SB210]EAR98774.1 alpha/beta superfamily hydrolase [Tetrahymena thermophila SB210]|eukprot:XP_001019019.1 alpha/beta superfamily hydrolase [Tetrahymena thermophila SB210]
MGKAISKAVFFQPPSNSSYNSKKDFWIDKLIFVNEDFSTVQNENSIPCLYCPYQYPNTNQISNKLLIFFHGTGNDIGQDHHYISEMRNHLQVTVLGVEYPGYGVYKGKPTPEGLQKDALTVYKFALQCLLYPVEDIIVVGLSMGTGPAAYLSSQVQFSLLVLLMPYMSWRDLAKDKASFVGNLVPEEYFNNFENIKIGQNNCKMLIIHGEKDEIIPVKQSKEMQKYFEGNQNVKFMFPSNMGHLWHDIYYHSIFPIKDFLYQHNIQSHQISDEHSQYKLQKFKERFY